MLRTRSINKKTKTIIDERILRMGLYQHRLLPIVDWSKVRIEKALAEE